VRVFLAGATGAIGRQLVPMLIADGHSVVGTTRSSARAEELTRMGAEPAVLDALDARAVSSAVEQAGPDAIVHQLTALPARIDPRRIERDFLLNDRLRTEGTSNLLAAARQAGVARIVAQSIAFVYAPGPPGTIHDERDPLLQDPPRSFARTLNAVRELERAVLDAGGVVLRYGYFYGAGSAVSNAGSMAEDVRRRRMPIVGRGAGVWSFVHVEDAARATVSALERGGSGVYNVVDDEPAPVREWLPAFAAAVGAPRPLRVPTLLARPLAGSYGIATMTRAQGASNARARRELGWSPRYASWRDGFLEALG